MPSPPICDWDQMVAGQGIRPIHRAVHGFAGPSGLVTEAESMEGTLPWIYRRSQASWRLAGLSA